jgi:small subunit ribosomal protein S17
MRRKIRRGEVISNRMEKTVVVRCVTLKRHPLYKKTLKRYSKLYAHDEKNECQLGDKVKVIETRPLSKMKRWRVVEILERKRE